MDADTDADVDEGAEEDADEGEDDEDKGGDDDDNADEDADAEADDVGDDDGDDDGAVVMRMTAAMAMRKRKRRWGFYGSVVEAWDGWGCGQDDMFSVCVARFCMMKTMLSGRGCNAAALTSLVMCE